MKTKCVRLYGKMDLRLEEIELPEVGPDDVQVKIVSDTICLSTYKGVVKGAEHKKVPDDVAENPVMVGHEFCGDIVAVGENWKDKYTPGQRFSVQPSHYYKGSQLAIGFSYRWCGGSSQYGNMPIETLITGSLLPYNSDVYFIGSLCEPMSCVIGTFHAMFHTTAGRYVHDMGIRENGKMALLAACGPMGLAALDYALHNPYRRPSLIVVTDINDERLAKAASVYPPEEAKKDGITLIYVNTKREDATAYLRELTGGTGFDDVICFSAIRQVIEQAGDILGYDGCLDFFAGPTDSSLKAEFNFYNVHYLNTHVMATSGGNADDMREAVDLASRGIINPAAMVTHVGGLNAVVDTVKNLPKIPGGKKLIYNEIDLPLTAIEDFAELGKTDPLFAKLDELCKARGGLWNAEAEKYLRAHAKKI